jgi:hypothetical protein
MQTQRMQVHDYSRPGFYMVTMVIANRQPLFGTCRDDSVHLSPLGEIIRRSWAEIHQTVPPSRRTPLS